jgi:hypothetical protein
MTMPKRIFFITILLTLSILSAQVGTVHAELALPVGSPVQGTVLSITLDNDASTGITTVIVNIRQGQELQKVRLSQETAIRLGFVVLDGDGKLSINDLMLGKHTKIEAPDVLPAKDEKRHPVGDALATFFSGIEGLDYDSLMSAHETGIGFGIIAQVLWLTQEIPDADFNDFQTLLEAKKNNTYTGLPIVDDSGATITPSNWGELRKAILAGKQVGNLGTVMSDNGGDTTPGDHEGNDKENVKENHGKDREKERKNPGAGNGNNK